MQVNLTDYCFRHPADFRIYRLKKDAAQIYGVWVYVMPDEPMPDLPWGEPIG